MPTLAPYRLKQWQDLVSRALVEARPQHARWKLWEHMYRTGNADIEWKTVPTDMHDDLGALTLRTINRLLPHLNMVIASSVDRAPDFIVEPYGGDELAERGAQSGQELLRYFWKRLRGTDIFRDMVQDAVIIGNGFAKTGWAFEDDDKTPEELAEELQALMESDELAARLEGRPPAHEDDLLAELEEAKVLKDEPWLDYVSPYDIFVPQYGRRLDELDWIIHRVIKPRDEVMATEGYDHLDTLKTSERDDRPDRRSTDEETEPGTGEGDDPFAEVTLYEGYDMRTRKLTVFQTDSPEPLFVGDLPHGHRYTPFIHLRNFEDGGSRFWSFGDMENVAAIQAQLNEYIEEQMSNARRSGQKYAVDADKWTKELKLALESDLSDVVFKIATGGQPIGDFIQALPRQGLSPDVYQAKEELQAALAELLGLNDFQTGGTGADRMSATAAAVVDGTATLRGADKRAQVERAIGRAGLLLLLLCQENLDEETAVRVVKDDGIVEWLKVSKEDLVGEYDVSVETGSTQAINPATRQQRAVEMLQGVIPQLASMGYDPHPLVRKAIRDYGFNPDRLLKRAAPAPPAEAEGGSEEPVPAGIPAGRADVESSGEMAL